MFHAGKQNGLSLLLFGQALQTNQVYFSPSTVEIERRSMGLGFRFLSLWGLFFYTFSKTTRFWDLISVVMVNLSSFKCDLQTSSRFIVRSTKDSYNKGVLRSHMYTLWRMMSKKIHWSHQKNEKLILFFLYACVRRVDSFLDKLFGLWTRRIKYIITHFHWMCVCVRAHLVTLTSIHRGQEAEGGKWWWNTETTQMAKCFIVRCSMNPTHKKIHKFSL